MRHVTLGLLLALAAAPAAALDTLPDSTARSKPFPQAYVMQAQNAPVSTCDGLLDAYLAAGWPRAEGFPAIKQIDRRVKDRVALRNDPDGDIWTPLARQVITGMPAQGDCDDVSVTNAQLAVCAGMPAENLGLLVTESPNRRGEMHMVAFYKDPADAVWVFGDTLGRPRPLSKLGQKLYYFAYLDRVTDFWAVRDQDTGEALLGSIPTSAIPAPDDVIDLVRGSCSPDPLPGY